MDQFIQKLFQECLQECQQTIKSFMDYAAEAEATSLSSEAVYNQGINDGITIGYRCAARHLEIIVKQYEIFLKHHNNIEEGK